MNTHEFANGKISFVVGDTAKKISKAPHMTFVNTRNGLARKLDNLPVDHLEMWVEAAESNLIDVTADLTDAQRRNIILTDNNNILFDQVECLKVDNDNLRDENEYLKDLAGLEDTKPGDVVWSKASGKGPFVILSEQAQPNVLPTGTQKLILESWLVRDSKGKDHNLPKAEATKKSPPMSFVKKILTHGLFWTMVTLVAGTFGAAYFANSQIYQINKPTTNVETKR